MIINDNITLLNDDCINAMKSIEDGSVDMILCDLPFGTLNCKWDVIIPFDKLWKQYNRVIKKNGCIALFSSQPFTTQLIASNIKDFKYEFIWVKNRATKFVQAHNQPLKKQENICIFYKSKPTYNPQGLQPYNKTVKPSPSQLKGDRFIKQENTKEYVQQWTNYPNDLLYFDLDNNKNRYHATQKPVPLLEYLIKTYTNENDLVLDNTMGSGSTAIAAINTNRKFIGMELNTEFYNISVDRVNKRLTELNDETINTH